MQTFVTHPEEGGPFPVVFFYMDAPGKREELHDMARRLGTAGYMVVLPNLYYRQRTSYELRDRSPDAMAEMQQLMFSLSHDTVIADTGELFDFVDGHDQADASRVGCFGYCMSGPFAVAVAAAYPERIKAAASLYGVRLATDAPDSPHRVAARIKGEVYVAHAELDSHVSIAEAELLEKALADAGVRHRVEIYASAHHGFAFPGREGAYDKTCAERHWERLHALFGRNLR
jgi:carboxymethylenebutenolidase